MKYEKAPFTARDHINILKSRGLIISDEARAIKYLKNVGYFRLTGYMYHLQSNDGSHLFAQGTSFDDIILHYQFDKKLRALIQVYTERIEVALRANLTDKYSVTYGFFWYTNHDLYRFSNVHDMVNYEISEPFKKPQENFLKKFKHKYYLETIPPSNMAMEVLTMGKLSRLYEGLKNSDERTAIATEFDIPFIYLHSFLIYLTNVRNVCAHHARLWNKRITANKPTIPSRKAYKFNGVIPDDFNASLYGIVSILDRLLRGINPTNSFIEKFLALLNEYPSISTERMGFPESWKENPAWKKMVDSAD